MQNKEEYCFKIMRTYGLLIDFEGEVSRKNLPAPIDEDETLKRWIQRVLGPDVSNVVVYMPESLDGKRRMRRLAVDANAAHVQQIVRASARVKNTFASLKTEKAVARTRRALTHFPLESLRDHMQVLDGVLEPSVKEFFERQIAAGAESEHGIDADALFRTLIIRFNEAARQFRKLSMTHKPSTSEASLTTDASVAPAVKTKSVIPTASDSDVGGGASWLGWQMAKEAMNLYREEAERIDRALSDAPGSAFVSEWISDTTVKIDDWYAYLQDSEDDTSAAVQAVQQIIEESADWVEFLADLLDIRADVEAKFEGEGVDQKSSEDDTVADLLRKIDELHGAGFRLYSKLIEL